MKRRKPAASSKPPRNPHARALGSKLFRGKVVEPKPPIPRKAKHRKPPETEESAE
jgi:ribosomal protein L27